ncbi:MAG TPA: TetR/AcrR family transcriptional regulator [Longimicrobium sp.]|nr:TetR/AcrR family transcriptional regulator [Longimicrobium sp.]
MDDHAYTGEMTKLRQDRSVETRRRIIEAARELFHADGFDATSADAIAERAGVAKGTVFLHAGSKERLLLMAYEAEVVETATRALAAVDPAQPLARALHGVFAHFFALYERDLPLARRFVKEQVVLPHQENPLAPVTLDFVARLAELIARRQSAGELHPEVDPALAAQISFALYYGVLVGWLSGWIPDTKTRDRMLSGSLALHWA